MYNGGLLQNIGTGVMLLRSGFKKRNLQLACGTFLMAVAYKSIFDSVGMVTGGFSGISVIVRYLTMDYIPGGIPLWITNTILNVPLFIAAYLIRGKNFVYNTLVGTVLLTLYLGVLPTAVLSEADYLLAAVAGGVFLGAGMGLVLNAGATTGGTDMLGVLLAGKVRHYSVVRIIQILDGIIIVAGILVFGLSVSLYAIIAIYITALVSDRIVEGAKSGKVAWIISDRYEEISRRILKEMDRGATLLKGSGVYSGRDKNVILCILSKKQIPVLKAIVTGIDDKAFFVIGDVREVCGEGFVQISQRT